MKRRVVILTALLALWAAGNGTCRAGANFDDTVNMPITETRDVMLDWLSGAGFLIFHHTQSRQLLDLTAEKDAIQLHITARPHSPLATRIRVETHRGGHYALELKKHLDAYINLPSTRHEDAPSPVPSVVRRQLQHVVCIYTAGQQGEVQLTGFVVDRRGFILCTAHDLEQGQPVSVALADGAEIPGTVIRLDSYTDVALIRTDGAFDSAVNLQQGRFMLSNGDRLFSISCAYGGRAGIETGVIDGPPRRVSGLPLWQARMRIDQGSSGSPVFDSYGRLSAMVKGRFRGTDAVGFLIPFETLLNFLGRY